VKEGAAASSVQVVKDAARGLGGQC
jgi:hypothetical protein